MACANTASPLQLSIENNTVTSDGASSARGIAIGLGNPQQVLSLMPTTADSDLFVFNSANCEPQMNDSCIAEKGGVFDTSSSTTYVVTTEAQWNGTQESALSDGSYIYFNDELRFGTDGVSYGFPAFLNQPGYGSQAGLPLGANSTFVAAVYESGNAPSKAWGLWPGSDNIYTPQDGLLVIGGYDAARVDGDWTEFPTAENCATCVWVDELAYVTESGSTSLLANSSDSLEIGLQPFIYGIQLPQDMFERFATASAGTYDADLGLLTYDIDNPPTGNISVTLANGYQTTLPAEELFSKPRGYNDDGVYVIVNDSMIISNVGNSTETGYVASWGRPFLTMNYLLVDFDNETWKLAPAIRGAAKSVGSPDISTICGAALPTASSTSDATATAKTSSTATASSGSSTTTSHAHKTNVAAIAGGVAGGVGGLALILLCLGFLCWRSKRKSKAAGASVDAKTGHQGLPPAYAQSQGPHDAAVGFKPAVAEVSADQRASVWTNSAPTEYSELASPEQRTAEFSPSSPNGHAQKPFIGATSGPLNEPVEMPTDHH